MTKEELRAYGNIKAELRSLNCLAAQIDFHATEKVRRLYDEKRQSLEAKLTAIEEAIETLDYTERQLMRLRYIEGKEWHQVSRLINYSDQQTHRIHARALRKLRDK